MHARWQTTLSKLALIAALIVCASACGGPTFILQQYDGAPRPPERVAIIRFYGASNVQLVFLDGEQADARVAEDARLHVEVLPGKHRLAVANLQAPMDPPINLEFEAEPARFYRVVFVADAAGAPASPRIYQIDPASDALKKDVTLEREGFQRQKPAPVLGSVPRAPVSIESSTPAEASPANPPAANSARPSAAATDSAGPPRVDVPRAAPSSDSITPEAPSDSGSH